LTFGNHGSRLCAFPGGDLESVGSMRTGGGDTMIPMRRIVWTIALILIGSSCSFSQNKRLWVLRAPGELAEYDATTFALKRTLKVPAEAVQSPENFWVNPLGQMLFVSPVLLPLAEDDVGESRRVWFWNGQSAINIQQGVSRASVAVGSNSAITESAPLAVLSADGSRIFWFANQARRLVRGMMDLTTANTFQAWTTDLRGAGRQDLASTTLPDCQCGSGSCQETCPYGDVWAPEGGVSKFWVLNQFVAGRTAPEYKSSFRYDEAEGKWGSTSLNPPLRRILDSAADGSVILEAIPDTGCCGWANQSNDQTLLLAGGKTIVVFDELATFKNPDYDVSFYTSNAKISSDRANVAMTIVASAKVNSPIQLAEQGQADPEESRSIRRALADLPAVEIKTVDTAKRVAFLPHAALVGWINDKEILVLEGGVLSSYNLITHARRKTRIAAKDVADVFLR
jgi:hypothetical protein